MRILKIETINSAASDATNKVNSAKNEFKHKDFDSIQNWWRKLNAKYQTS